MTTGAPLIVANENNLVDAIVIQTSNATAAVNVSDTGELVFTDVNGVKTMSALIAGSGFIADYYTKVQANANFLSANTAYATPASVVSAYNNAVQSASTYADRYAPSNNTGSIQYKSAGGVFAGSSLFTFANNTVTTPYLEVTNSGTTYPIILTDVVDGLRYGVCLSGGTLTMTAV